MIAKPANTLIISLNNNTPLVESNPGNTQWKSKIKDPSESLKLRILVKSEHISMQTIWKLFLMEQL